MTKKEKMMLLREWQRTIQNSKKSVDLLATAVGTKYGPLQHSVFTLQAVYTRAISMLLGCSGEWLEWYAVENEMGAKGLVAGFDGDLKPVRNLSDLLNLITAPAAS